MFVELIHYTPRSRINAELREKMSSKTRRNLLVSMLLSTLVIVGVSLGFHLYWSKVVSLHVLTLNTWLIPEVFGSKDKQDRIGGICKLIQDYDVVLLQEIWMRNDHEIIKQWVEGVLGYHMTSYDELSSNCDGLVTPSGCSGLAIVSRFAFDEVSFVRFKIQGSPWNMFLDGEFFAGKGLGRVTVKILPNMAVDFLVTHLVSESNYKIREAQAHELVQVVIESQADFVVLAGDFNTAPMTESDRTYNKVAKVMADAFQEAKGDPSLWHDPHFATYGHTRNSYTNANSHPTIFDYIFLRKSTMDPGEIWVKSFSLPDLHIVKPATQTHISISDHEAVASHIYLWKQ